MSHSKFQWARLDTAAKIFPCTSGRRDTKVFRFVCEMTEPVRPEKLQQALERTVDAFPGFQMTLKRGIFWYYLEKSDIKPEVEPEHRSPCAPLYDPDVHTLLFEVTYYGSRVNLEVFHAIADGTGAMNFLRVLIFRYLQLVHPELDGLPELDYDASEVQSMDDSFEHYANRQKRPPQRKMRHAFRLRGSRMPDCRLNVITGTVPVSAMLALSHRRQVSLTVLLCGLVIQSIRQGMAVHDAGKAVVLAVPVNLRNHFASASARNFFGIMEVGYDFSAGGDSLENILASLEGQFRAGLSPELLQYRVNQYISLIRNPAARMAPLFLKDVGMRFGSFVVSRRQTSAVSNIGVVCMPPELEPYLRRFEAFVSTEKLQMCVLSYGDSMALSFSSAFQDADIQRRFFRALTAEGIPVEIDTDAADSEESQGGAAE